MKMKSLRLSPAAVCVACALLTGALSAQTTVPLSVEYGGKKLSVTMTLRPKVGLSAFTCDVTEMEPGDVATCTITLTAPAKVGITVMVVLPAGFTGPSSVVISSGLSTATFSITRLDLAASSPTIFPVSWALRLGACTQRYAGVLVACCARADRCSLRDTEIDQGPCGG
jgi:hypothetical protein